MRTKARDDKQLRSNAENGTEGIKDIGYQFKYETKVCMASCI